MCLTCFGAPIPGFRTGDSLDVPAGASGGSTALSDEEREQREKRLRLAKAGIHGCRSWMAYLAERHEDPPWADAMRPRTAEILGLPLLKATMVVAYLQETGRLPALLAATARARTTSGVATGPDVFEEALGTTLLEFEEQWREWIVDERPGILQRLDGAGGETLSGVERTALASLEEIRKAALEPRVMEEFAPLLVLPELSAGALAHVRYLHANPDQMAKWPDAHEEWPDREGYSVEGSAAGLRSVIAPDVRQPQDAIDAWMATFYHRLPLLAPGLRGIGFAHEQGIAVLDAGSLVEPWASPERFVLWPYEGMKDVPRRFRRELPNPVPGESQAAWGYPVTIQGGLEDQAMTMRLYAGKPGASREVECHLSTPWHPTNPELAPPEAACLIPKSPLEPSTTYTVVIEHLAKGEGLTWTFKTGR
jgi:hypothetical protein